MITQVAPYRLTDVAVETISHHRESHIQCETLRGDLSVIIHGLMIYLSSDTRFSLYR